MNRFLGWDGQSGMRDGLVKRIVWSAAWRILAYFVESETTQINHVQQRRRQHPTRRSCDETSKCLQETRTRRTATVGRASTTSSNAKTATRRRPSAGTGTAAPSARLSNQHRQRHSRLEYQLSRSTQPCIPPGSLNRVPASAVVRAGISPLSGGR